MGDIGIDRGHIFELSIILSLNFSLKSKSKFQFQTLSQFVIKHQYWDSGKWDGCVIPYKIFNCKFLDE